MGAVSASGWVTTMVLVALLAAGAGFLLARSQAQDGEAIRSEATVAGITDGAERGRRRGFDLGFPAGRRATYREAYEKAYRSAYRRSARRARREQRR